MFHSLDKCPSDEKIQNHTHCVYIIDFELISLQYSKIDLKFAAN